ncbi:Homoserine dehydrogenase [Fulvia fulva]|uniref:Homoserine dehydrogenase n=1 Tax=Passalora fulva TaxID=5499 RepID=A0A9Q8URE2_PASFU|nr:Homoserine dehydrogenase [Fulvia fulva]KAK4619982.1 Homoserine dehydrogenase [Fulvia fulva]KAK4620920.1 Homoserine dehydrogenase [Fulvia fulva]UJO19617.1 Homoserine dehydrogenase [Fulvia fulva]WPV17273.1 Homoserine dehydrogenase [Fulvia fulva]WPV31801.1 Homoserine dehydrogenase [Fulvia fulva]
MSAKQVFVAVIGLGGVGKAFLSQLSFLQQRLSKQNPPIDLRLVLARRSTKQLFSSNFEPLNVQTVAQDLDKNGSPPPPFNETFGQLARAPGKVVLVDNTSDQGLASLYPMVLQRGISIVTPNKKAFSDKYDLWHSIFSSAANGTGSPSNGYIFHESTVGAGLPVISSLKELVETGDEVAKIEGVFSGTMSFLFNSFQPVGGGGGTFAAEVKKAKGLGYTEPDARDDLNGLDVARKLTILARIAGLPVESPTSFPVQSLIPKDLESAQSGDDFLEKLPQFDSEMEKIKDEASKEGKVVRFVGSIDVASKQVKVGLEKFDVSHPIAALKGSDNIISFYTKRYGSNPLIIQGAGAGGDVTAMGVTGDLLKVVRMLQ